MGRASLHIDEIKLQNLVTELEATQEFPTVMSLCETLADKFGEVRKSNGKMAKPTAQVIYQRLNQFKIAMRTKAGHRGRQPGQKVNKTSRQDKLAKLPVAQKWIEHQRKNLGEPIPERYKDVAESAAQGNLKAIIEMKCAACCGFESHYKACTSNTCSLVMLNNLYWPNRRVLVKDPADKHSVIAVSATSEAAERGVSQEVYDMMFNGQ